MALITTIEQVRENGVKLMFTNNESSLADMDAAEERFIVPVLGDTLYNDLKTHISDTDIWADLLNKVRKALAPLSYWLDLPNIQTQITDTGVATFGSENMQQAHRWEFEYLRNNLADKGCYALESLLKFLFAKKADYNWSLPTPFKIIILTGDEFYNFFPVYQPHRTFISLRPLIRQVEDQYIRTSIGDDFFEELRDKANPSAEEAKIISWIKASLANLTIRLACEVLPVKISENGFTVLLTDNGGDKETQGESLAPDSQIGTLYKSVEKTGQTYLSKLKDYLNTNASNSLFATYFTSDKYLAPAVKAEQVDPNTTRTIFGLV